MRGINPPALLLRGCAIDHRPSQRVGSAKVLGSAIAQYGFDPDRNRRVLRARGAFDGHTVANRNEGLGGLGKPSRELLGRLRAGFSGCAPHYVRAVIMSV